VRNNKGDPLIDGEYEITQAASFFEPFDGLFGILRLNGWVAFSVAQQSDTRRVYISL
jgi:hypothetical protein